MVKTLAEQGVDMRGKDSDGAQPLHAVANNKVPEAAAAAAEALLAAGADLAVLDGDGKAPLELVLERSDAASCHRLLRVVVAGDSGAALDGEAGSSRGSGEAQVLKLVAAGMVAAGELRRRQAATASDKQKRPAEPGAPGECVVCMAAPKTVAVTPCGHVALCGDCADELSKKRGSECPICRKRPIRMQPLFFS